ncbi:low-specificity L-threonine aldolase [Parapusillimonas sp. JC17]|uniref:low-specificity L-threonine aldolase n=1 Tax=Parapusillimonas sp. JC17 TaxID=3445768 RepID=UPI003F9F31EF
MSLIDLRSDTVTRPSEAMRAVIAGAEVGDDTYGDDPSTNALQAHIAGMLGFEAALFMPTGTQANLCAILSHCQRGDEYIAGQDAHCYRFEGGGAAMMGGVQPQPIAHAADGTLSLDDIAGAVKPDDPHFPRTRLLALENTLGGRVMPMSYLEAATTVARSHGLNCHLDGARLFNAAVAQAEEAGTAPQDEAKRIAKHFDSVSVCFSKGLGAPVGSALCGSADFIARARRLRKTAGGGMRQAGILAAAADYALTRHIDDLARDHRLARRLADGLQEIRGLKVLYCATNMVFVEIEGDADDRARTGEALLGHLRAKGILTTGVYTLRFVTHRDVDEIGIDRAIAEISQFFKQIQR